jgi:hypothetical protein
MKGSSKDIRAQIAGIGEIGLKSIPIAILFSVPKLWAHCPRRVTSFRLFVSRQKAIVLHAGVKKVDLDVVPGTRVKISPLWWGVSI